MASSPARAAAGGASSASARRSTRTYRSRPARATQRRATSTARASESEAVTVPRRSSPAARRPAASSPRRCHARSSKPSQRSTGWRARNSPGAMSAAASAASIASVPEPHIGSRNAPPSAATSRQPATSRTAAASVSFIGAATCTPGSRYPRRWSGSPARSTEIVAVFARTATLMRTSGSRTSTLGLRPKRSRNRSVMPSLVADRGELGVAQRLVQPHGVDREGSPRTQVVLPRQLEDARVQRVGGRRIDLGDGEQNPGREPAPVHGPQAVGDGAGEQYPRTLRAHAAQPKTAQLIGEQRLDPGRTRREESQPVGHGSGAVGDGEIEEVTSGAGIAVRVASAAAAPAALPGLLSALATELAARNSTAPRVRTRGASGAGAAPRCLSSGTARSRAPSRRGSAISTATAPFLLLDSW